MYILDLPLLFEDTPVLPQDTDSKTTPELSTFVDDTICTVKLNQELISNQDNINQVIHKLEIYMRSNSLIVNTDKTKFVVITKTDKIRQELFLATENKNIRPIRSFKFLGISIEDNLTWNSYLIEGKDSLLSQLKCRLSAIRKIRKYIDFKLCKMLANGLFFSKLTYGSELWLGAPQYIKKLVQSTQLEAARITIGHKSKRWSTKQLLSAMGWNSVEDTLVLSSAKMTHRILHEGIPENHIF